jgi:WD40-like Beta Propeller Repeat
MSGAMVSLVTLLPLAFAGTAGFRVVEQRVAQLPPEMSPDISFDGLRATWVVSTRQGETVYVDGKPDAPYDEVEGDGALFSRTGAHCAYVARRGGKRLVVIDGRPGPEFDEVREISFIWETDRSVYRARRGERWMMVVDEEEGPECDRVVEPYPSFSADGRHHAYPLPVGPGMAMVTDGSLGPVHEKVEPAVYGAAGAHLAYAAKIGGTWHVVLDGEPGPGFEWVQAPFTSPDGSRWAYYARNYGPWFPVADGVPHPEWQGAFSLSFSPDSQHLLFLAERDGKVVLFTDGQPGEAFDSARAGALRPALQDGQVLHRGGQSCLFLRGLLSPLYDQLVGTPAYSGVPTAVLGRRSGRWFLVVDGVETAEVPGLSQVPGAAPATFQAFRVSPDQRRAAWVRNQDGMAVIVVDGRAGPAYESVGVPVFSPDSRHVAYRARRGKTAVMVLDGVETAPYPLARRAPFGDGPTENFGSLPVFSPDSRHLAFVVEQGRYPKGQAFVVLDGRAGPRYSQLLNWRGPTFRPDGSLEYLAMRGNVLFRTRHVPGER